MTTAATFARGRDGFRRWRRGRPFWGGLLVILSGLFTFYTTQLDLGMTVHIGQEGFLAWIIPSGLALCGLLLWLSPAQRLFYGIVAALIAVYSLIGVNLGGFFVGMLLGIVGGALGAAWTPDPTSDAPAWGTGAPQQLDDADPDPAPSSGVLTDELPTSTVSPLHDLLDHEPRHAAVEAPAPSGAGDADAQVPPAGPLPRRDVRMITGVLATLTLAAACVSVLHAPQPVLAAPCPPTAPPAPAARAAPAVPATPGVPPPVRPAPPAGSGSAIVATTPPAVPAPPAEPERPGPIERIVDGVVDFFRGLFGGGKQQDPAPSATPSRSASPTPSAPASSAPSASTGTPGRPTPTATRTRTTAPPKPPAPSCTTVPPEPKVLAAAPGQPPVAATGATMLAGNLTMSGLSFDGVVDLPTRTGTIKVLQFSMRRSVSTPFELRINGGAKVLSLKSTKLTVEGDVKFYTSRFEGRLLCLIPVTFTPQSPPPLILPELLFCDANITLHYVRSNVLTAPNLTIVEGGSP